MNQNGKTITIFGVLCILACMITLTAYSVPLYELFCRVTGYGGTTQIAKGNADRVLDRTVTVRFNADTNTELPWNFRPVQNNISVKIGEPILAFYRATSLVNYDVTGTATFNVVPNKAGKYFNKVDCFCFTDQILKAKQTIELPVQFHIDPAMAKDKGLDDIETITLSYTFFKSVKNNKQEPIETSMKTRKSRKGSHLVAVN